jgi:hypothetical protein
MKTLTVAIDKFDQVNTFNVEYVGTRGVLRTLTASLRNGGGEFWALKNSACLKDSYTDADDKERNRLASESPVKNNDVVLINNEQYKVRVNGNYSDCAIFTKVVA